MLLFQHYSPEEALKAIDTADVDWTVHAREDVQGYEAENNLEFESREELLGFMTFQGFTIEEACEAAEKHQGISVSG